MIALKSSRRARRRAAPWYLASVMSNATRLIGPVLGLVLLAVAPACAQSNDEIKALRKDIEELKQSQKNQQQQLDRIMALISGRAGAQPIQDIVLDLNGLPEIGDKRAKITIVEFTDYQCSFCARHASQTFPQIQAEYIKTGKIKYVVRDFPLDSIHPAAEKAAEAAHCAGEQGKYWEMRQRLFANQRALGPKDLQAHAQALGLDGVKFGQCLDNGKYASLVRKNADEGQKAGVEGTPTFFLGMTSDGDSKLKPAKTLRGAYPYAAFKEAIDGLLSGKQ